MPEPTGDELAAKAAEEIVKEEAPPVEIEKTVAPDPTETAARAQGWKPKDEFTGDPGLWVDAKEFVGRAPLFDKIKGQSKELKEIKKTVDAMAKHFTANVNHAVQARIAALKSERKEAIEGGDVERVDKLDRAIEEQKQVKADIPTAPEVAPEVMEWVKANDWYTKDAELHDFALAFNDSYLKRNPGDIEGSLKATATATRKAFPEKFPTNTKPAASAAPAVESATAPAREAKKYTVGRLTSEQKMVYDQLVKPGHMKHDDWFKSLEEIGELR